MSSSERHARQFATYRASVVKWYTKERWRDIYPFLAGTNGISRRLLEHLVTDYSRTHKCEYLITDPSTGQRSMFNIYHSAQTVLSGVHKCFMDPFRRVNTSAENGGKLFFGYGKRALMVSVCELVFFRWAYKHGVLDYAVQHKEEIKADMAQMSKLKRNRIEQVEVELPPSIDVGELRDDYWVASTMAKKQLPKKKRKRYRESNVNVVMNEQCEIQAAF